MSITKSPETTADSATHERAKYKSKEKKSHPRLSKFAKNAGSLALSAAVVLNPQSVDAFESVYATVATAYDLPGSEITDTIPERNEAETRKELIEVNEAKEITTFQTESGITLEVMQSGLGDNAENPIEVDQDALEANLDFIIDNLDDLNQDEISQEDIAKFQQKAASGKLDYVTFTLITSVDGRHCVNSNKKTFSEVYGTQDCKFAGMAHNSNSRIGEARSTINSTLLVAPARVNTPVSLEAPGDYSMDPDKLFDTPTSEVIDLVFMESIATTTRHEMAHGIMSVLKPGLDSDTEHEQFVEPLTQAGDTLMLGWVDNYEKMQLHTPFSIKHTKSSTH